MDPKGKGMVVNDKKNESFLNEPRDDKPNDSDESSSSPRDDNDEKKKPVNSK
jgi:hypothetical protein